MTDDECFDEYGAEWNHDATPAALAEITARIRAAKRYADQAVLDSDNPHSDPETARVKQPEWDNHDEAVWVIAFAKHLLKNQPNYSERPNSSPAAEWSDVPGYTVEDDPDAPTPDEIAEDLESPGGMSDRKAKRAGRLAEGPPTSWGGGTE